MAVIAGRKVLEIATYRKAVIDPNDPVEHVRKIMRDYGYRLVAVIDERGGLKGIISRAEALLLTSTKSEALASHIMREPPIILEGNMSVEDAVKLMLGVDEWYAPVVERNMFKTIMGLEDVIVGALENEGDRGILESVSLEEVMTRNPIAVTLVESIDRVWRIMVEYKYAGAPVVDSKGVLVGIITQYDLLRKGYTRPHLEAARGPGKKPKVKTAMTRPCTYLYPWSSALEAATLLINRNIGRIPIVESENTRKLVGIVDREDIVKILL